MRQAAYNNKGIPLPRSFRSEMTHVVQKYSIVNQRNICTNWGIEEHKHFSFRGKVNKFEMHNLTIKTSKPIFKVQVGTSQQKRAKEKAGSVMLWPKQVEVNLREALFLFKRCFLLPPLWGLSCPSLFPWLHWATLSFWSLCTYSTTSPITTYCISVSVSVSPLDFKYFEDKVFLFFHVSSSL